MNRKVRALQGVSLSVRPGEVYGLLGPNGAGKSTTIKILMNLVQASSGEARLFGQPSQDCAARQEVGFLPENPAPYEYLSGAEFVRLAGSLGGLFGRELDRRVAETLGEVGMEHAASLPIRRYSKGMIQRIGLAQAIVTRPKLLILDEPTSGLDPVGRRQMRDLVSAERARGTTVLFCTHIIPDVEALCDRVAVLVSGKLVKEGSVRDLVTSQVPLVELVIEGLGLSQVRALGEPLQFEQEIGQRVTVRTDDAAGQRLLRAVLSAGGRVAQLSPARFSLEDLFMETVAGAKQKVGGEIN
ncbi:MAG: ABC transporter ATP-binding protein [Myxococcales bacterium]|nr:ABC transporter ATP-binding protein [Myxococcales bacterium]